MSKGNAAEKALKEWKAPDFEKEAESEKLRGGSSGLVLGRWNQATDRAAKNQDPETAERLILQIPEAGLTPDTVSYNSVMHACARTGDPRRVEHWYLEMKREGVEANTITHNIMIDAYVTMPTVYGGDYEVRRDTRLGSTMFTLERHEDVDDWPRICKSATTRSSE